MIAFVAVAAADDKDKKLTAKLLEGTYTITKGEKNGQPVPEAKLKGSVLTFSGDRITGHDPDKKEFFACTYKLIEGAKPQKVEMVSKSPKEGEKAFGIVELENGDLKICYSLPGEPVPTSFKTKEKQHCFTLKREDKK